MRARVLTAVALTVLVAVVLSPADALASSYAGVVDADAPAVFAPLEGSTTLDTPAGSCTLSGDTLTGATLVLGGGGSLAGGSSSYGVGCIAGSTSTYFTLGTSWSIEAWFQTSGSHNGCEPFALTFGNNSTLALCLNWGQSNRTIALGTSAMTANCDAPASLANSAPHYVAATSDGSHVSIYVDGAVPATGNNNGPCSTFNAPAAPGAMCWVDAGGGFYQNNNQATCSNSNNAFCNGGSTPCMSGGTAQSGTSVGEVAVYTYTLTGAQVAAHYAGRNGGPARQFAVTAVPANVKVGATWQLRAQATDQGGADVTSSTTFSTSGAWKGSGADGVVVTCDGHAMTLTGSGVLAQSWAWSSSTINCHASAGGNFTVDVTASTVPNTTVEVQAIVGAPSSSFSVGPSVQGTQNGHGVIGEKVAYRGTSLDAAFQDVSATDSWTWSTVPAHVTCSTPLLGGSPIGSSGLHYFSICSGDAAGSYTLTATDSYGLTANTFLIVGSPSAAATCGSTDLGCWLNQLWDAINRLAEIPGQLLDGLRSFLFVSSTGRSYIDLAAVQAGLIPLVNCRAGQLPDHPDGVHCVPFPFSVPFDVLSVFALLNQTPMSPEVTLTFDWSGSPFGHVVASAPLDLQRVLTPTLMTWVRDGELVLFVIGLGMGTWRFTQMTGTSG